MDDPKWWFFIEEFLWWFFGWTKSVHELMKSADFKLRGSTEEASTIQISANNFNLNTNVDKYDIWNIAAMRVLWYSITEPQWNCHCYPSALLPKKILLINLPLTRSLVKSLWIGNTLYRDTILFRVAWLKSSTTIHSGTLLWTATVNRTDSFGEIHRAAINTNKIMRSTGKNGPNFYLKENFLRNLIKCLMMAAK